MLLVLAGIGILELIVLLLVIGLPFALFVWAIVDLIKRDFPNNVNKVIWALVIIIVPFFGSLVYLIAGRKAS
jgi:hypothetical protein